MVVVCAVDVCYFMFKQMFTRSQPSRDKCSARTMDEDDARLAIHTQEPKIILHGSGKTSLFYCILLLYCIGFPAENVRVKVVGFYRQTSS